MDMKIENDCLKEKLKRLQNETSEQWQREANPELVKEKQKTSEMIKLFEDGMTAK